MTAGSWPQTLLSRIEDAGLNASAPPQQRWIDGWLVRFSPGKAQRARCINAVSAGLLPVGEKLAICDALYRQSGLRMLMRITPFSQPPDLDGWLGQHGFQRFGQTAVMVCDAIPDGPMEPPPEALRFESASSEAYAHILGNLRGTTYGGCTAHAERLTNCPVPLRRTLLRGADGTVKACALSALEGDLVGLYDVFTADAARGRGLARWLCARLLAEARQQGAKVAYLQVEAQNHAALKLYRRLGFVEAYSYHYRALPSADG